MLSHVYKGDFLRRTSNLVASSLHCFVGCFDVGSNRHSKKPAGAIFRLLVQQSPLQPSALYETTLMSLSNFFVERATLVERLNMALDF